MTGVTNPSVHKPGITAAGSLCQDPHIDPDRERGRTMPQALRVQHDHQYYVLPKQKDDPENYDY